MADPNPNPNPNQANQGEHAQNSDEDDVDVEMNDDDSDDDLHFEMGEDLPDEAPMLPGPMPFGRLVGPLASSHSQDNLRHFTGLMFNAIVGNTRFVQNYRVLSVQHLENRGHHQNLENGGKVILPPSALQELSRNSDALIRPMMFKASKVSSQKFTHCGVLEFIAEDGVCYMPSWMMEMLEVRDFDDIQIQRIELPIATFAKFQPQSVDFLEISDPKAMLENSLRFFACLTKGDIISIHYNSRVYKLLVLETLPRDAVNIIECDMNVDFAEPVGYVSPDSAAAEDETVDEVPVVKTGFVPFLGGGKRINGKNVESDSTESGQNQPKKAKGSPDTDWVMGTLQFKRVFPKAVISGKENGGSSKFTAFGGAGLSLKNSKKVGENGQ